MATVASIERACFDGDAYPKSLFRLYAADPRAIFVVASVRQEVTGYIIARTDRWGAEIVSIAVHPSAHRRGIGTRLVNEVVSSMQRRSAGSMRLMVRVTNSAAMAFYRRRGFRYAGRVADYYEDGAAAIRMRLPLALAAGAWSA